MNIQTFISSLTDPGAAARNKTLCNILFPLPIHQRALVIKAAGESVGE